MAKRKALDFGAVVQPVKVGATARDILQKTVDDGVTDLKMAKAIRVDLIDPDPHQPRQHFDEQALDELAQSIRVEGVLQPITVEWISETERFRIVFGERRWRATKRAAEMQEQDTERGAPSSIPWRDLSRMPALIQNLATLDRYLLQLYENEQREGYTDIERALAYERIKETLALTWEELAQRFGLSVQRIYQIRRLKNTLEPSVVQDVTDGALTGKHALPISTLPAAVQPLVASEVKEHEMSVDQTREMVQQVRSTVPLPPIGKGGRPRKAGQPDVQRTVVLQADSATITPTVNPGLQQAVADAADAVTRSAPRSASAAPLGKATRLARQLVTINVPTPLTAQEREELDTLITEVSVWLDLLRDRAKKL